MKRADIFRDMIAAVGAASISAGCGLAWLPLGLVVGGLLMIAGVVLSAPKR